MCLRILQKLIKPPAATSKKNKVRLSPRALPHVGRVLHVQACSFGGFHERSFRFFLGHPCRHSDHRQALQQRNPCTGPAVAQEGPQGFIRGLEEMPPRQRYGSCHLSCHQFSRDWLWKRSGSVLLVQLYSPRAKLISSCNLYFKVGCCYPSSSSNISNTLCSAVCVRVTLQRA